MKTTDPIPVLPLAPGTMVERYKVLSVLGQGACGIAYLVKDEELGRRVMLKEHAPVGLCHRVIATGEIQPLDGQTDLYIQSLGDFLQEATVLSTLRLSAVPEVYEVFEAGGTACCVLSYVEGLDLSCWLAEQPDRRRLLPMVLAEALRSLGKLHRLGIRHRDIKPGHMILDSVGTVNFIDFGSSCSVVSEDAAVLVPSFTPPYSPPEQGVETLECAASDLYALAASFYEVTRGQKPPSATARLDDASLLPPLVDDEALHAEFPLAYLASLDRALSLEPQKRYSTAEQWLHELTSFAEHTALPQRSQSRRWWVLGFVAGLAAALVFVCWVYRPDRKMSFSPPATASAPSTEERGSSADIITHQSDGMQSKVHSPELYEYAYDLPYRSFSNNNGEFLPEWQGECTRIDLVGADELDASWLPPVFLSAWLNHDPHYDPANLALMIVGADGKLIASSCKHRYNADTKTLTFDFEKSFRQLPKGWKALVRMQGLSPESTNGQNDEPIRAARAVFYCENARSSAPQAAEGKSAMATKAEDAGKIAQPAADVNTATECEAIGSNKIDEILNAVHPPELREYAFELPNGLFSNNNGEFLPQWEGVCTRIDLIGADDLDVSWLVQSFMISWLNSHNPSTNPAHFMLKIVDAEGKLIASSCKHRYNADTKTLTFGFAKPLHQLPEGWKALVRMPLQPTDTPNGRDDEPIRATRAVFYCAKVQPLDPKLLAEPPDYPASDESDIHRFHRSVHTCINHPFGIEINESLGKGTYATEILKTWAKSPYQEEYIAALCDFAKAGYPLAASMLEQYAWNYGYKEISQRWEAYPKSCGVYLKLCDHSKDPILSNMEIFKVIDDLRSKKRR